LPIPVKLFPIPAKFENKVPKGFYCTFTSLFSVLVGSLLKIEAAMFL
jgi:hypothetical protein